MNDNRMKLRNSNGQGMLEYTLIIGLLLFIISSVYLVLAPQFYKLYEPQKPSKTKSSATSDTDASPPSPDDDNIAVSPDQKTP